MSDLLNVGAAAYISPSGKRQVFKFENVSRDTDLKTATAVFPELDGAQVQDLGVGGRRFPFTCIFDGARCREDADAFEKLLCERGAGVLEHPIYGTVNVVPTGTIKRSDGLISNIGEATIEIVFAETLILTTYPTSEVAAADRIEAALDDFDEAAAKEFADLISVASAEDRLQFESITNRQLDTLTETTGKAVGGFSVDRAAAQKLDDLTSSSKGLVKDAKNGTNKIELAASIINIVRLPSKFARGSAEKAASYAGIINSVVTNAKVDPFGARAVKNQFATTNLIWSSAIASLASGIALTAGKQKKSNGYTASNRERGAITTREEAIGAAEEIQNQFNEYKKYLDKENSKNNFVDASASYENLLEVVVSSVQVILQISFALEMRKEIVLERDRQVVELVCELYGQEGFARLDEFINENNLNADEIVLIPMGRGVRYYVQSS